MWSWELFKQLTLTRAFCFLLTCHRGLRYLQHVSRLLHLWPLVSAAGLTNSNMALQGQALAFPTCLVWERSHSQLELLMSCNVYKTIYAWHSICLIFWWKYQRFHKFSKQTFIFAHGVTRAVAFTSSGWPPPSWGIAWRLISPHFQWIFVGEDTIGQCDKNHLT